MIGMALVIPAVARPATQADAVLAAARAAAGTKDRVYTGFIVESGSEFASGLRGTWSQTTDLDTGRSRQASNFDLFSTAEVWDGDHDWRQDMSGGVHPINSAFMRGVHVTDAWLAQFGYLQPGALGAQIEMLDERTADGLNFAVVRATPRNGQPVELWFDAVSHLLARTVQVRTIDVRTVRYADYRNVAGMLLPFKLSIDYGSADNVDEIHVERVARGSPTAEHFAPPRAHRDFEIAGGTTTVPIEFDGDVIVEARLNGQGPFAFILDTGGHDILTPAAANALGLKAVGAGQSGGSGAGTVPEQYTRVERMDIGAMTMHDQPFTVIPLSFDTVERGARPPLAGILGLELFERFAMRLDYRARTLTFEALGSHHHRDGGTAVPIFFSDDEPLLVAKINGLAGDVGLDTGNSGSLIVQGQWADAHGLKEQMMRGFPSMGFGMGGASNAWSSRADFEVAGFKIPQVVARYIADTQGAFSSRTESGNVGNDILANFRLDFDYGRGQIAFEPVAGATARPFDRAGATVIKESAEAFKVVAVAAGTPAAEAGLQVDDEIVAIDGSAATQLSGWDFRRAMRQSPQTKVQLSIVRAGKPLHTVLTLRELLS
ncbi:MAG: aspartyl protease family protein [Proteobacteria bacterium]|nr:aspartyl protease family protein [Pseudomonadota bacterium]